MPELVQQIKTILDRKLRLAPTDQGGWLPPVMRVLEKQPQYALDAEGNIAGLNLAETELTDSRWQQILALPGLAEHLQALHLGVNHLTAFPFPDGKGLRKLKHLNLAENKLKEFSLPEGLDGLVDLDLEGNPLENPGPELLKQGKAAVVSWLNAMRKDREKGSSPVFLKEIKILLVGEGKAGKTSLLKRFKDLPFDEHENQTHGVNVETLEFDNLEFWKKSKNLKGAKGRFWDFGGQEILHASHQFFLTERSLYILLVDSRNDEKTEYWLRHIDSYGGGSPAIVVLNKIEANPNFNLEQRTLNKNYPFIENRFFKISCKTDKGLDELRESIAATIVEMKRFKEPIPADWELVKNDLEIETSAERYISRDRFLDICKVHDVTDPTAQSTLLEYLNDLGIVLHFKELGFNNIYVLDPHWVTIGVYKIINSSSIPNGLLKRNQLDYILNHESQKKEEEYEPNRQKSIKYNADEQTYLVQIMAQFELLYQLRPGEWLIPDLLPKEPEKEPVFEKEAALNFVLTYDFLPPSLFARFFIRMKSDLTDIRYIWRTGALLQGKMHLCSALVRADKEQKRIYISVGGDEHQKREYFAVIRHALWQIHETFRELTVKEYMPVPGHPEELVEYIGLQGMEKMGKDELVIGKLGLTFSVKKDFLDKISTPEERKTEPQKKKPRWIIWGGVALAILAVLANIAQAFGVNFGDLLGKLFKSLGFQGW